MFKKILIANRGEIACRIVATARKMGIATVAVYSQADARALHVEMADEAVEIGPPAPAQSYLAVERILEACKATGADAVHPGYGFLSERAMFAAALQAAGIVFIGPNARAIGAMGDKIESKKAAARAKVSTIPGHLGAVADAEHAVGIAEEIGYPVMIKASAGGGGRGMRIARNRNEVQEGFASAGNEAKASFGDDSLLVEKYIVNPRHIEIQVLGDKHGNVVHLGERECSIQRRNQKVVEEAPSPHLDDRTRKAMGEQAVALAKAVGYDSAGTVEFVAGQDRSFFFLEMNTRIQVEHPVTELVTGIDIVEQMIRVAAGEKLPFRQADIAMTGWAVESRICAEDPSRSFLPSTGRLSTYRPPPQRSGDGRAVRIDTGVREGDEISIHYDSLIAKLVAHGATRAEAIDLMADALDAFAIEGLRHNIAFLGALMQHPRWRAGRLSTGFIAEEYPAGFAPRVPSEEEIGVLAVVAAAIDHLGNMRRRRITQQTNEEFRFAARRVIRLGSLERRLDVSGGLDGPISVTLQTPDGTPDTAMEVVTSWWPGQPVWSGRVDGRNVTLQVRPVLNGYTLTWRGSSLPAYVYTEREAALAKPMPVKAGANSSKVLRCPMPGVVKAILASEGDRVKAGDPLAVVEAMKMENILRAEHEGIVKAVKVKPGDSLAVDAAILEFV